MNSQRKHSDTKNISEVKCKRFFSVVTIASTRNFLGFSCETLQELLSILTKRFL